MPAIERQISRQFLVRAALVVCLAGFNGFARLGSETVTEWDESLYATSAAEMIKSRNWIATTFNGQLDYYNSKPPLNVWLIAVSFKAFGVNITALRLPSATAAVLTVVLLVLWLRRAYSEGLALMAGLALSTSFAFFYVHSGRTANPDSPFTLLTLATISTLWFASATPRLFPLVGVWLAAAFLLRGFGALLLVAVVVVGAWVRLRPVLTLRLIALAAAIAAVLIGAWVAARWSIDGWTFFRFMLVQDALNHVVSELEGHPGSIFFYLNTLQKYQYDWIAAAVLIFLIRLPATDRAAAWLSRRSLSSSSSLLAASALVLLAIPSMMQTKTTWYASPLLPLLAIVVGAVVVHAVRNTTGMRRAIVIGIVLIAAGVAESRLIWHSFNRRDLARSEQGLLLAHKQELAGHMIYRGAWTRSDNFVAEHLIGVRHALAPDLAHFLQDSAPGDFFVHRGTVDSDALVQVGSSRRHYLYQRAH